jgi:hypothetical protein
MARSGLNSEACYKIVVLSRLIKSKFNEQDYVSIRGGIILAKIVKSSKIYMSPTNMLFRQVCKDVFNSINTSLGLSFEKKNDLNKTIDEAIDIVFSDSFPIPAAGKEL